METTIIPSRTKSWQKRVEKRDARRKAQVLADGQVAGLRALADLIEANPEFAEYLRVPLASLGTHVRDDAAPVFARFARAAKRAGATVVKDYSSAYAKVHARFGVVEFHLQAMREEVCERVVTAVQTVTKSVPDPAVIAAAPLVEVTEEVETVEWVCRPLLAQAGTRVTR